MARPDRLDLHVRLAGMFAWQACSPGRVGHGTNGFLPRAAPLPLEAGPVLVYPRALAGSATRTTRRTWVI